MRPSPTFPFTWNANFGGKGSDLGSCASLRVRQSTAVSGSLSYMRSTATSMENGSIVRLDFVKSASFGNTARSTDATSTSSQWNGFFRANPARDVEDLGRAGFEPA